MLEPTSGDYVALALVFCVIALFVALLWPTRCPECSARGGRKK